MKTIKIALLFSIFTTIFASCIKDSCEEEITYTKYIPVAINYSDFRVNITSKPAETLKETGKIYFYQKYIFINEKNKGIHIIDNHTPNNPQNIGFLPILGNTNISIKNHYLYADNYTDLLVFNIENIDNIQLVKRTENAFDHYGTNEEGKIIVAYKQETVTEIIDCKKHDYLTSWDERFSRDIVNGNIGTGGSFNSFIIHNDMLYTVQDFNLKTFDISNQEQPVFTNTTFLGDAETTYTYGNHLFVGKRTGMDIFSLEDPSNPIYISGYTHFTGCDPVFVYDNHAYVTIHTETTCMGSFNQLDVLDITDITNPTLMETFPMEKPHGLAVNNDNLYLCEGNKGLKIFDNTNPLTVGNQLIKHISNIDAYDVILLPNQNNILLLIGQDGFYQFDITNPKNPIEISHIPVTKP